MRTPRPVRFVSSSALLCSSLTVPPPTVPSPAIATLSGAMPELSASPISPLFRAGRALIRELDDVVVATEECPDVADGLSRAMAVLDEREADAVVAVLAEADAGRHGDLGFA